MSDWTEFNEIVPASRRYPTDKKNNRRSAIKKPSHLVLHITGPGSVAVIKSTFLSEKRSAHYLIDREGKIHQFVPDAGRAWHAGIERFVAKLYNKNDGTWRRYKRYDQMQPKGEKYFDKDLNPLSGPSNAVLVSRGDGSEWPDYEYFDKRWGRLDQPFYYATDDDPNDYSIGIEMLSVGAKTRDPAQYTEALYEGLEELLSNLCRKYGIPRDREHIIGHEDVDPCARWGWDPNQGFDWSRVHKERKGAALPFETPDKPGSPVHYLYRNESQRGGYFPVGVHQNIHSGIHLSPNPKDAEAGLHPVRCIGAGTIVALRLPGGVPPALAGVAVDAAQAEKNELAREISGNSNALVLVRHDIEEILEDAASKQAPRAFTLYSLYMHLAHPRWDAPEAPYAKVPWLNALALQKHGTLIVVDPDDHAHFGERRWLVEPGEAGLLKAGKVKVYGETFTVPQDLALSGEGGRIAAIRKDPDADVTQALGALAKGKVITFSRPFLRVGRGELLGYVSVDSKLGPGFLHWEILAPSGDTSQVMAFLKFAEEALTLDEGFFKHFKEKTDNNYFDPDQDELKQILETLPDEGDKEDLLPKEYRETDLVKLMQDGDRLAFAVGKPSGAVTPPRQLYYPATLRIDNFKGALRSGAYSLKLRFKPPELPPQTVSVNITSSEVKVDVMLPAAAETVIVEPVGFHFRSASGSSTLEEDVAHFKHLVSARFRNVVVEHLNEWSPDGLLASLKARYQNPEDELKRFAEAMAFWAHDEQPILGEEGAEEPLFAESPNERQLPKTTKLDNMHPVAAAWLLNLLSKHNKAAFKPSAPPKGREDAREALYAGWAPAYDPQPPRLVGDPMIALSVSKGDVDDEAGVSMSFSARGAGWKAPLEIGRAPCKRGLAYTALRLPFWGKWTLEIASQSPEPLGAVTLSVLTPVLAGAPPSAEAGGAQTLAETSPPEALKNGSYQWRIDFQTNRPRVLQGWILIKTWKRTIGAPPPAEGDPDPYTLSTVGIPIEARPEAKTSAIHEKDFVIEGGWIVKGPSDKWLTDKFTYGDYCTANGGAAPARLSKLLAEGVQSTRVKYASAVYVSRLSADGLSVSLTATSLKKLKTAADQAQKDGWFQSVVQAKETDPVTVTAKEVSTSEAGELLAPFDPAAAFGQLLTELSPGPSEEISVKLGYLFLNGGGLTDPALASVDKFGQGFAAKRDFAALRERANQEYLEAWAKTVMAPLSMPSFGPLTWIIEQGSLVVTAPLRGGSPDFWKAAAPVFDLGDGKPVGAVTKPTSSAADANARQLSFKFDMTAASYAKKELKIKAKVTKSDVRFNGATAKVADAPVLTYNTTPRLKDPSITESPADHPVLLRIQVTAHAFPTNRILQVYLKAQPGDQKALDKIPVTYTLPHDPSGGFCDGKGAFEATIPLCELRRVLQPRDAPRTYTVEVSRRSEKDKLVDPITAERSLAAELPPEQAPDLEPVQGGMH